jgi:arginine:pyruvate transaminase
MARITTLSTGVPTDGSEVLATIGGQAALFTAAQGCLDAGDHAIVVGPYYATYPGVFRACGVAFTVVDTHAENGFQPLAAEIEAAVRPETRLILINSPNNPTGAIYSRDCLESIAAICRKHDLWLLSDEVYWSFAGGERPHLSPRALPGMAERTLVINSMSKSHAMTGWRVGWLAGPRDLIAMLVNLNLVGTYGLIDFVSRAAVEALDRDYGVADISERYARRRNRFLNEIRGTNGLTVRGSEGGMYVMLDIRDIEPDDEAFAWAFLDAEKVAVMPGSSFGTAAAGHIRISLTQPEERLAEAARRLRSFAGAYGDRALQRARA